MSQQINEFAINLPVVNVPPVVDVEPSPAEPTMDPSVVIGAPDNSRAVTDVSVYADSITPSGTYDTSCPVASFDVVFSVGIREGDTSKTYRVVKRIGIDKCKLACEAECSAPVSIVEHKTEAKKAKVTEQARRFRQIAGLE